MGRSVVLVRARAVLRLREVRRVLLSARFTLKRFLHSNATVGCNVSGAPRDSVIVVHLVVLYRRILRPLHLRYNVVAVADKCHYPRLGLTMRNMPKDRRALNRTTSVFVPGRRVLTGCEGFVRSDYAFSRLVLRPHNTSPNGRH